MSQAARPVIADGARAKPALLMVGAAQSAPYTKRLFVHHFRITSPEELDDEFAGWVRESYAVGEGKHLGQPLPR